MYNCSLQLSDDAAKLYEMDLIQEAKYLSDIQ